MRKRSIGSAQALAERQLSRRALLRSAGFLATGPMWWQNLVAGEGRGRAVPQGSDLSVRELPPIKARWIWYPEQATPPVSFMFFRKSFHLEKRPAGPQIGWVSGNSRYMLYVNG